MTLVIEVVDVMQQTPRYGGHQEVDTKEVLKANKDHKQKCSQSKLHAFFYNANILMSHGII